MPVMEPQTQLVGFQLQALDVKVGDWIEWGPRCVKVLEITEKKSGGHRGFLIDIPELGGQYVMSWLPTDIICVWKRA